MKRPAILCVDNDICSLEKRFLRKTLMQHRWNKSSVAKESGQLAVDLRSWLERYQLEQTSLALPAVQQ